MKRTETLAAIENKEEAAEVMKFGLSQLCGGCYIFMVCSTHVEWLPKYYQMGYRNQ